MLDPGSLGKIFVWAKVGKNIQREIFLEMVNSERFSGKQGVGGDDVETVKKCRGSMHKIVKTEVKERRKDSWIVEKLDVMPTATARHGRREQHKNGAKTLN